MSQFHFGSRIYIQILTANNLEEFIELQKCDGATTGPRLSSGFNFTISLILNNSLLQFFHTHVSRTRNGKTIPYEKQNSLKFNMTSKSFFFSIDFI